jgi:hypothetical protein
VVLATGFLYPKFSSNSDLLSSDPLDSGGDQPSSVLALKDSK